MAVKRPLVAHLGSLRELGLGDTLPGALAWGSATLDFGAVPTYSGVFTLFDVSALTTSRICVTPAPASDEAEMDGFALQAACYADGIITVYAHAVPGPVTGSRNFNYFLG